jgi:dynein light chain roadblock-type
VLATIVLDRTSGSILNTSGTLSSIRSTSGSSQSVPAAVPDDASSGPKDQNGVDELAGMVWNYMNATKDLVQGLDEQVRKASHDQAITADGELQDEVKLLRLRTKKYELVIVPDSKYLLVVVHETPSA